VCAWGCQCFAAAPEPEMERGVCHMAGVLCLSQGACSSARAIHQHTLRVSGCARGGVAARRGFIDDHPRMAAPSTNASFKGAAISSPRFRFSAQHAFFGRNHPFAVRFFPRCWCAGKSRKCRLNGRKFPHSASGLQLCRDSPAECVPALVRSSGGYHMGSGKT
jgi:hypothetical protein